MTFSILAYDEKSGAYMGAAATGSLCVGGWVLRGGIDSGLAASQGTAPSTFWRDEGLALMRGGEQAGTALAQLTGPDTGRAHRQLSLLDLKGGAAGFTGTASVPYAAHIAEGRRVAAGNMLTGPKVLDALLAAVDDAAGDPAERLVAALRAGEAAGSDRRGLRSAALLVLHPDAPPLDLRIDRSQTPLDDLAALLTEARRSPYADWLHTVPVASARQRAPEETPEVTSLD
ncbi:DUF1028 domain-containing protein [Pseudoroseicyclus sp. CXY001]|uniref:DUF1028 domain-containing protein n=1 Tax=Pseudoroseicyclus sp. CXY001 TaxID=3242492 RepID=UPI00358DB75A